MEAPSVPGEQQQVSAGPSSEVGGAQILNALVEGVRATKAGVFASSPQDGTDGGE